MRPRILIFDDNPAVRQLLLTAAERRGYESFTFQDPSFCPLHAKDQCPCESATGCADIIISDLDMPNVKGLDFVETLVVNGCRCRHIALMSRSWSAGDIDRARRLRCRLFAKPFQIGEVTEWFAEVERTLSHNRGLERAEFLGRPVDT